MTKAFAYLRVSGHGQISGDGFQRQLAAITVYALANAIEIAQVFREEGVSGTKELDDRPALMELISALQANGVKTILVEKLDRLARDLMVQETLIAEFRKQGFTLISVLEPDLLQDDPSRKLMRQIFGAIAEYDKSMIVLKLRGARKRMKAATGRCEGRKPFGHYEGEPPILSRIMALSRHGLNQRDISSTLNAEGMKPRTGAAWHPHVIGRIVRANR